MDAVAEPASAPRGACGASSCTPAVTAGGGGPSTAPRPTPGAPLKTRRCPAPQTTPLRGAGRVFPAPPPGFSVIDDFGAGGVMSASPAAARPAVQAKAAQATAAKAQAAQTAAEPLPGLPAAEPLPRPPLAAGPSAPPPSAPPPAAPPPSAPLSFRGLPTASRPPRRLSMPSPGRQGARPTPPPPPPAAPPAAYRYTVPADLLGRELGAREKCAAGLLSARRNAQRHAELYFNAEGGGNASGGGGGGGFVFSPGYGAAGAAGAFVAGGAAAGAFVAGGAAAGGFDASSTCFGGNGGGGEYDMSCGGSDEWSRDVQACWLPGAAAVEAFAAPLRAAQPASVGAPPPPEGARKREEFSESTGTSEHRGAGGAGAAALPPPTLPPPPPAAPAAALPSLPDPPPLPLAPLGCAASPGPADSALDASMRATAGGDDGGGDDGGGGGSGSELSFGPASSSGAGRSTGSAQTYPSPPHPPSDGSGRGGGSGPEGSPGEDFCSTPAARAPAAAAALSARTDFGGEAPGGGEPISAPGSARPAAEEESEGAPSPGSSGGGSPLQQRLEERLTATERRLLAALADADAAREAETAATAQLRDLAELRDLAPRQAALAASVGRLAGRLAAAEVAAAAAEAARADIAAAFDAAAARFDEAAAAARERADAAEAAAAAATKKAADAAAVAEAAEAGRLAAEKKAAAAEAEAVAAAAQVAAAERETAAARAEAEAGRSAAQREAEDSFQRLQRERGGWDDERRQLNARVGNLEAQVSKVCGERDDAQELLKRLREEKETVISQRCQAAELHAEKVEELSREIGRLHGECAAKHCSSTEAAAAVARERAAYAVLLEAVERLVAGVAAVAREPEAGEALPAPGPPQPKSAPAAEAATLGTPRATARTPAPPPPAAALCDVASLVESLGRARADVTAAAFDAGGGAGGAGGAGGVNMFCDRVNGGRRSCNSRSPADLLGRIAEALATAIRHQTAERCAAAASRGEAAAASTAAILRQQLEEHEKREKAREKALLPGLQQLRTELHSFSGDFAKLSKAWQGTLQGSDAASHVTHNCRATTTLKQELGSAAQKVDRGGFPTGRSCSAEDALRDVLAAVDDLRKAANGILKVADIVRHGALSNEALARRKTHNGGGGAGGAAAFGGGNCGGGAYCYNNLRLSGGPSSARTTSNGLSLQKPSASNATRSAAVRRPSRETSAARLPTSQPSQCQRNRGGGSAQATPGDPGAPSAEGAGQQTEAAGGEEKLKADADAAGSLARGEQQDGEEDGSGELAAEPGAKSTATVAPEIAVSPPLAVAPVEVMPPWAAVAARERAVAPPSAANKKSPPSGRNRGVQPGWFRKDA